jgi:4-alpha-glucanotransferase
VAVRTYRDLSRDPATGVAAVDVAAPTLAQARALARQLQALPTVQTTRTIDSLTPNDQPAKIQTIAQVAPALLQALNPPHTNPPPTNAENGAAIVALANALPRGPQQDRLRALLGRLEQDDNAQARVATALTGTLRMDFARLSAMLRPEPVTQADLPSDLRRLWLAPNSQARVQILPKGDATNTEAMAEFARQVQSVAPQASGTAITLLESRNTVIRAFIEAGAIAILSIAIILFITLRRVGDVALTLVPLLVAGAVTLEVAVLIGQDLNFANIIALPLLLGVGVAFKIYYILAWRRGATNLLQSTLTRAIFFSALTTMTAFGSLWLSQQPGMSSMGKLMALALLCTLLAAVLFQPALMGPPRNVKNPANDRNPAAPANRPTSSLDTLAERAGIEPEFRDARGDMKTTPPETKRRLLAAMGVKADTDTQAGEALAALDRAEWARALPPVVVAPAGAITIGVVQTAGATSLAWQLTLEDGSTRNGQINPATLALSASGIRDGAARERRTLVLDGIPEGYHGLQIGAEETTIIATPEKCWLPDSVRGGARLWGVAAQLYLLRSDNNWGIGDFSDLRQLIGLLAPRGADVIGLNPLHAMFLDRPEHASPYSPASRLLLNVLNIDVLAVPELATCPAAQHLIANPAFQARLHACRAAALVNYPEVARLKLEALTTIYTACRGVRQPAFESFRQNAGPMLQRGCVFQALREHLASTDPQLADWHNWPEEYRDPGSDDVAHFAAMHADRIDFRAWLQFLADQQLAAAAATARDAGMQIGLYRDLAVGADPAGAETWSNPRAVADGAQVGAPPDIHNPAGQNWGLPPFNPHALREEAYASFIELVRANMRHAGGLRIDHVMALQHLYWIPTGAKPDLGAYVRYDINALVGILALESQRHHCIVVGEDLGTVPDGFRERMAQANILSYRVLFFEQDQQGGFLPPASYPSLALSVAGSHDLPTLRGWWHASDIALKDRLGLYPEPGEASRQTAQRDRDRETLIAALRQANLIGPAETPDTETLVRAAHAFLAQTPSILAMAQIDDVTGEADPVNVPATTHEHPNWRRRQSITLEAMATQPELDRIAKQFNQARKAVLS